MKPVKHDTWNAIFVGNQVVQNLKSPSTTARSRTSRCSTPTSRACRTGRPELFDIEQMIREKDERITSGSQMMHNIVNAQYWQLTGPEAPTTSRRACAQAQSGRRPRSRATGSRSIEPWMPEFQLEQFLTRIDREMVDVTGLNDLLRGMAPAAVMSSSKAINALVANYETRIR